MYLYELKQSAITKALTERATRTYCAADPMYLDSATAVDLPNPRLAPVMITTVVFGGADMVFLYPKKQKKRKRNKLISKVSVL